MFSIAPTRPLATLAVLGGLLVAAAPAGATVATSPKDTLSGHHVRDLRPGAVQRATSDGTSNTVMFAEVEHAPAFSGDAYVNEMGLLPNVDDEVLTSEPQTRPHADGIIAILIGLVATNDDERGQNAPSGLAGGGEA